jgi:hypothetical protein
MFNGFYEERLSLGVPVSSLVVGHLLDFVVNLGKFVEG